MPNSTIITGITLTGANTLTLTDFTGGTVSTSITSLSSLTVTTTARVLGTTQLSPASVTDLTTSGLTGTTITAQTLNIKSGTTATLFNITSNVIGMSVITGASASANLLSLRNASGSTTTTLTLSAFTTLTVAALDCHTPKITGLASSPNRYLTVGAGGAVSATTLHAIYKTITTPTYNLQLSDGDSKTIIETSANSANMIVIQPDSVVNFNVGTNIGIVQGSFGQTRVSGATGVTILSSNGLKLRNQYSLATLIKEAPNTWYLTGDLVI